DPDDCLAYLLALRADADIVGVSIVGGNVPEPQAWLVAQSLITKIPLWRGGIECGAPTIIALADALRQAPITVMALGPLTNIATFINCHPTLVDQIDEIIFVG
ncbi:MAG: hypothetical protein COU33_01895, partial [Candidatus Magasanikbacteria bacterium CG10_big_fil_rev_8_21_14_0_10_43_6]